MRSKLLTALSILTAVMAAEQGESCSIQADCNSPEFFDCVENVCVHKPVLPPSMSELIGIIILPLLLGLANNGGIGGGGLIIPVSIALYGFTTIEAIGISNAVIFVGAAVKYFGFSIYSNHPQKGTTIIDYQIAQVMLPMVLGSSFLGVIISHILSEAVLTILLCVLLVYMTYDSFSKATKAWQRETAEIVKQRGAFEKASEPVPVVKQHSLFSMSDSSALTTPLLTERQMMQSFTDEPHSCTAAELQLANKNYARERSNWLNWPTHLLCLILTAFLFTVNLLRGTKHNPSVVEISPCGPANWCIFAGAIVFYFFMFYLAVGKAQKLESLKQKTRVGFHEGDISYQKESLVKLMLASVGGGFAGAVGLGGGIVFNPVLIGMGMHPLAATSTGMYMIMFGSFSNALTFWLFGSLPLGYALWIGLWSAIGIYIILAFVGKLIKKSGRPSIIIFFLAGVIALSAVAVPFVNINHLLAASETGQDVWAWGSLCE